VGTVTYSAKEPVPEVGLGDRAEHPVTHGVVGDAGADGVDLAGEVLAQHQREPVLHVVLGVAGGDGQVEPIDRRGMDPDPDLTLGGLGYIQVSQGRGGVEAGHGDSTHGILLAVGGVSIRTAVNTTPLGSRRRMWVSTASSIITARPSHPRPSIPQTHSHPGWSKCP
jgi:hypothetical protein